MLIEFSFDATAVPHHKQNYLFALSPEDFLKFAFNQCFYAVFVFFLSYVVFYPLTDVEGFSNPFSTRCDVDF